MDIYKHFSSFPNTEKNKLLAGVIVFGLNIKLEWYSKSLLDVRNGWAQLN